MQKNVFKNVFCSFLAPLSCGSGLFSKDLMLNISLNPRVLLLSAPSAVLRQVGERRLPAL